MEPLFHDHPTHPRHWAYCADGELHTDEGRYALSAEVVWPIWSGQWYMAWQQQGRLWCRPAVGGDALDVVAAHTVFCVQNQLYAVGIPIMSIRLGYLANRFYGAISHSWPLPPGPWTRVGHEIHVTTSHGVKRWIAQPPGGLWQ